MYTCYEDIYCLQQANKKGRHIVTPEQGMFIGPDQAERSRRDKERKIENLKQLEKVYCVQKSRICLFYFQHSCILFFVLQKTLS